MVENTVEELEERVFELEERLKTIENVFSPDALDGESTGRGNARNKDAREVLDCGDERAMRVVSPIGDGQEPERLVGKVNGVVTFIDLEDEDDEDNYEEGEYIQIKILDVSHSSAEGVALGEYDSSS